MEGRDRSRSLLEVAGFEVIGRVLVKCQQARRDERNGFPFSAAMEWRDAAGLCASISLLSDFCWREWERIMRLPRQMATPIGGAPMSLVEAPGTSPAQQPLLTSEAFLLLAA